MELLIRYLKEKFKRGEYAVSDHAVIEGRKDGIAPKTVEKLEWVAVNGKIIEKYPDRERILIYSEIEEDGMPVHIVVDHSEPEEPVIVTSYVPDSRHWIKYQIRKNRKTYYGTFKKKKMSRMPRKDVSPTCQSSV